MFENRIEAGRKLAERLDGLRGQDVVVVGLPRGGVPVAAEVARAIGAPLDVILVRKLGVPFQPELAMGAIGEDGVRVLDRDLVRRAGLRPEEVTAVETREREELARRARRYRGDGSPVPMEGKTVVVIDDGIATGATARAACMVARAHGARRIIMATPVAPRGWATRFAGEADETISLETPEPFYAIGQWYRDFSPTSDEEVVRCLDRTPVGVRGPPPAPRERDARLAIGRVVLEGRLAGPPGAAGVVLFAHGSGSSRHSPRNRYVARTLNDAGLATLLFDLLTAEEAENRSNVFDIPLLAERLVGATAWVTAQPETGGAAIGYFGASTGAAAALWAAAGGGVDVRAVVSRGGRPDLAADRLEDVASPTLLIVGSLDTQVIELNRAAQRRLRCESRIAIVPGATHLFEEPGTLAAAAELARDWYVARLSR